MAQNPWEMNWDEPQQDAVQQPGGMTQGQPFVPGADIQPWQQPWGEPQPALKGPQDAPAAPPAPVPPTADDKPWTNVRRPAAPPQPPLQFDQKPTQPWDKNEAGELIGDFLFRPVQTGIGEAIKDFQQTAAFAWNKPFERGPTPVMAQPTSMNELRNNPRVAIPKLFTQGVRFFPMAAGALAGGELAVAGGAGALATFGAGAGGASLATIGQVLGQNAEQAFQRFPNDPEKAYQQTIQTTAIDTGAAALATLAGGFNPFANMLRNMLAQTFVVQPAIALGGMRAHNAVADTPDMPLPDELLNLLGPSFAMAGATHGIHEAVNARPMEPWSAPWNQRDDGAWEYDPATQHAIPEESAASGPPPAAAAPGSARANDGVLLQRGKIGDNGAPKDDFFYKSEKLLNDMEMPRASGDQWLATMKQSGIKQEELDDLGLSDLFREHGKEPITKEQIRSLIDLNRAEFHDVQRGGAPQKATEQQIRQVAQHVQSYVADGAISQSSADFMIEGLRRGSTGQINALRTLGIDDALLKPLERSMPKYERWTLPGGENYRELISTLPTKALPVKPKFTVRELGPNSWTVMDKGENSYGHFTSEAEAKDRVALFDKQVPAQMPPPDFRSAHWDGIDNPVMHARISDRSGADGARLLHIEEGQSDVHNSGKQEGYRKAKAREPLQFSPDSDPKNGYMQVNDADGTFLTNVTEYQVKDLNNADEVFAEARRRATEDPKRTGLTRGVWNAPFKKTYYEMVIKKAIKEAVDKGYDRITWTPGSKQAEMYGLDHDLKYLGYKKNADGTYDIWAQPRSASHDYIEHFGIGEKALIDTVGVAIADKIKSGAGELGHTASGGEKRTLKGNDLKVEDAGKRQFYDVMWPSFLNKYGKKFGARVSSEQVSVVPKDVADENRYAVVSTKHGWQVASHDGMKWEFPTEAEAHDFIRQQLAETTTVHSFPITEDMRRSVRDEGQPFYQRPDNGEKTLASGQKVRLSKVSLSPEERRMHGRMLRDMERDIKATVPHAKVTFYKKLTVHEDGRGSSDMPGMYYPSKTAGPMIILALEVSGKANNGFNMTRWHESWHALQESGLVRPHEVAALEEYARKNNWAEKYHIEDRYNGDRPEVKMKETIAEGVGHTLSKEDAKFEQYPPHIRRILVNIRRALKSISRNVRKYMGEDVTAEEVLDKIYSGEAGWRRPEGSGGDAMAQRAHWNTPEFKRWFGKSQAVDREGKPMVVYHGTDAEDFHTFDTSDMGAWFAEDEETADVHQNKKGGDNPRTYKAYIRAEKPFRIPDDIDLSSEIGAKEALAIVNKANRTKLTLKDIGFNHDPTYSSDAYEYFGINDYFFDAIRKLGFDSVHAYEEGHATWNVLDPNQVKSADGNSGAFSNDTGNIYMQRPLDNPNFKRWFKGSKVVDDNGEPKRLYHGAFARNGVGIEVFDRTAGLYRDHGKTFNAIGSWFTDSVEDGNMYAGGTGKEMTPGIEGGNIMPVYASIKNPFKVKDQAHFVKLWKMHAGGDERLRNGDPAKFREWAKSKGIDGFVMDAQSIDSFATPGSHYYLTLDPNQIKSAVGNNGDYSDNPSILLQRPTKVGKGDDEVPVNDHQMPDTRAIVGRPAPKINKTVGAIGRALELQTKQANGGKSLNPERQVDHDRITQTALLEASNQFKQEDHGANWYDHVISEAYRLSAQLIPRLKDSATARAIMSVMTAISSNGNRAASNWQFGILMMEHYEKTGDVPTRNPKSGNIFGVKGNTIAFQLGAVDRFIKTTMADIEAEGRPSNRTVRERAEERVAEWLMTHHTVKELKEMQVKLGWAAGTVEGKLADRKVGAFIFGPKIGPFFLNINGIREATIDSWMVRQWGRLTGKLTSGGQLDEQGLRAQPNTATERNLIIDMVTKVADSLGIKPQDAQALLWYYEQRLYRAMGAKSARSESFLDGAKRELAARGIPPDAEGPPGPAGRGGAPDAAAKGKAPGKRRGEILLQRPRDDTKRLIAVHNVTADNLAHAEKLGGLPAPSLAVIKPEHPFTNFGEISLIAHPETIDPKRGAKAFASDVYSPRYPSVDYKVDRKVHERIWKELGTESAQLGHLLSSELDENAISDKGLKAFDDSSVAMLKYAHEKGIDIPLKQFDKADWEARRQKATARRNAAVDAFDAIRQSGADDPGDKVMREYRLASNEYAGVMNEERRLNDDVVWDLKKRFRGDPNYSNWVREKFGNLIKGERIRKGYNENTGRDTYVPHTLANVVKIMTKNIRDGEGFNYGVPSIRSKVSPQFRSVQQMREMHGKLIPIEQMKIIKQEVDAEFLTLAERMGAKAGSRGQEFGFLDSFSEHLKEIADRGNVKRVLDEYYANVTDEDVKAIGDFMQKLRGLPTQYFEVKVTRGVHVGEFAGAVVPHDVHPDTLARLQSAGIRNIKTYQAGDEEDRARAVGEFKDVMFQRPVDQPQVQQPRRDVRRPTPIPGRHDRKERTDTITNYLREIIPFNN